MAAWLLAAFILGMAAPDLWRVAFSRRELPASPPRKQLPPGDYDEGEGRRPRRVEGSADP